MGSGLWVSGCPPGSQRVSSDYLVNTVCFGQARSDSCFSENKACQLDSLNLLGVSEHVPSLAECEATCRDTAECAYYTYYDDEAIPFHFQTCYLFRLCDQLVDFPAATTGFIGVCTCSFEVEPHDGELANVVYAETEVMCKQACQDDLDCEIYTFFEPTLDCELLKNVSSFDKSSESGYHTGPGNCVSADGTCTFSLLDTVSHAIWLDSADSVMVRSGMLLDCKINMSMVLMGEGGEAHYMYCNNGGAGGSGYVTSSFASLNPGTSLDILFGSDGSVGVYADGEQVLQALKGGTGDLGHGGDGYSGGSYGDGVGGMDGGDATCEEADECGKGQGIDIQKLSSKHFSLTPGNGGEHK